MPKYIDHHNNLPEMPAQQIEMARQGVLAGNVDSFGVKGLNLYVTGEREAYCVSEAPDAESVVKSHAAMGLQQSLANVREVHSLV
jgi:hypothetical protein